jgi:hypothetical protein
MGISAGERAFTNRVVNPVMIALITHGLGPPTYAVVETTGRKTARKRLVPVGEKASYVHTSAPTPGSGSSRARPGCTTGCARWRTGTAHLMPDDDANARHSLLGRGRPLYRLDGIILRSLADGGDMLTIRIDLD